MRIPQRLVSTDEDLEELAARVQPDCYISLTDSTGACPGVVIESHVPAPIHCDSDELALLIDDDKLDDGFELALLAERFDQPYQQIVKVYQSVSGDLADVRRVFDADPAVKLWTKQDDSALTEAYVTNEYK